MRRVLTRCQPFPGDERPHLPVDPSYHNGEQRFLIERQTWGLLCVYDRVQGFETYIHEARANWSLFSLGQWFAERCAENSGLTTPWDVARQWTMTRNWRHTLVGGLHTPNPRHHQCDCTETAGETIELAGIQVDRNRYPALQQNAAQVKGHQRILPKPIVAKVTVNGHPARALLDSGRWVISCHLH